jgi:hypothetical protein
VKVFNVYHGFIQDIVKNKLKYFHVWSFPVPNESILLCALAGSVGLKRQAVAFTLPELRGKHRPLER